MSDWKSGLKSFGDKSKAVAKSGWHPEKDGTTLRGQVKGLIGRGEKPSHNENHVARPINELRDPYSFGPPPKRDTSLSQHQYDQPTTSPGTKPAPPPPSRGGAGGPPQESGVVDAAPTRAAGAGWKLDTTGLSTANLPRPPGRKDGSDGRSPVTERDRPATATGKPPTLPPPPAYSAGPARPSTGKGPGPALPPRLPPRSGNSSPVQPHSPAAAPALRGIGAPHDGPLLNQSAVSRLGAAGISVPGLGIGAPPAAPPRRVSPATTPTTPTTPQGGAATVAALGQRFGVTERAKVGNQTVVGPGAAAAAASVISKKKPAPPPPPKKKAELSAPAPPPRDDVPPPVPMSTRPTF